MSSKGPFELTIAEEQVVEIHSADELARCVSRLRSEATAEHPTAVTFEEVHAHHVGFGVGSEESFVHIVPVSSEPPYLITVGNRHAQGVKAFWLHEIHHTEIPRRNLIPAATALAVVSQFVFQGERSPDVEWEEI